MEKSNYDIEKEIADVLIERPHSFEIEHQQFCLYPSTLGKRYVLSRIMQELDVDYNLMKASAEAELVMLAQRKTELCCRLIAYHTFNKKEDIFNLQKIDERSAFFEKKLEKSEIATLIFLCLSEINEHRIIKHYKIDQELERMQRVQAVKKDNNSYSFCGMSIYGTLIDVACERYGWTMDYVLWGISYANLQLLINDHVKTIYLTDEERKHCHVRREREVIKADKENMQKIMSMNWN